MGRAPFQSNYIQHGKLIILEQQALIIIRTPIEYEIRNALFDIGDLKAPGSDGYDSKFFKQTWDIVKQDFTSAVLEFFSNGKLLKSWNHTLICLVPKSTHASKM